jgi:hypothetical protein
MDHTVQKSGVYDDPCGLQTQSVGRLSRSKPEFGRPKTPHSPMLAIAGPLNPLKSLLFGG